MKNQKNISLPALLLLFLLASFHHLNIYEKRIAPHFMTEDGLTSISLNDYESFKKSIMPLINQIGDKRIVALGEGTHGTYEFNKIRFWISRILVEEKGFNHIAFENDFSDSYMLNKGMGEAKPLESLMKKYLLRIWQTQEVKDMLTWMQQLGIEQRSKLKFGGIDNNFISNDVASMIDLLKSIKYPKLKELASELEVHAVYQDSIRRLQNYGSFQPDMKALVQNGVKGYQIAYQMELEVKESDMPDSIKMNLSGLLLDTKLGFNAFFQWATSKTESSRDSCMAEMANWMIQEPTDKIIIWAHNGHVAKNEIMDGMVGGMGGRLEEKMPGETFILGFGTSRGTHSAMEDRYINQDNGLKIYPLEAAIPGSWEERFDQINVKAFYAPTLILNKNKEVLPHRFIGYNPGSGENSYDATNLIDLYDGFIFIRETTASKFFE
ncbi:erythromycin esterase family protein [Anditalea andensis]|uniref:Erythromycin esterase n=1 Tax=Anditalea andensis TaxID=1048983 RepID=A0A074KWJ4_9BACT|nr:erythromycin esterase family protein [Anditalea andensis]KEO71973.1 hypothetical protein EL17_20890 [Anditalea andensis]